MRREQRVYGGGVEVDAGVGGWQGKERRCH